MIIVVGDAGVDVTLVIPQLPGPDEKVHASRHAMVPGGIALNTATAVARLGYAVALAARVGDDAFGAHVTSYLSARRVDTSTVVIDGEAQTYFSVAMTTPNEPEKRLVVAPTASLYPDTRQLPELVGSTWCHTVPFDPDAALVLARRAAKAAVPLSVDLEPATVEGFGNRLNEFLSACDTVIVNQGTVAALGNDEDRVAARLRKYGADVVVVTRGARGCRFITGVSESVVVPAFAVDAVDTTGAGDAFAAAYVCARVEGLTVETACRYGNAAGAIAATGFGAQGRQATRHDLAQLLTEQDVE